MCQEQKSCQCKTFSSETKERGYCVQVSLPVQLHQKDVEASINTSFGLTTHVEPTSNTAEYVCNKAVCGQ